MSVQIKIGAHHIGARNGTSLFPNISRFRDDVVNVLFEADTDCIDHIIEQTKNKNCKILPYCLGKTNSTATFNITYSRHTNSLLRPNNSLSNFYSRNSECDITLGDTGAVVEERKVVVRTLDSLMCDDPEVPKPDFLSMNVVGSELAILQGAENLLADQVVGVIAIVSYDEVYSEQNLISDILDFMHCRGFYLASSNVIQELSPQRRPIGVRGKGFSLFSSLLFLKRIDALVERPIEPAVLAVQLYKLSFISLIHGYVEYALDSIDAAEGYGSSEELLGDLEQTSYFQFLCEFSALAKAMPDKYPLLFSDLYSSAEVKRSFEVERDTGEHEGGRRINGIAGKVFNLLPRILRKANRIGISILRRFRYSDFEMHLHKHGLEDIAEIVMQNNRRDKRISG
jgi:FkbM family methyltransferase